MSLDLTDPQAFFTMLAHDLGPKAKPEYLAYRAGETILEECAPVRRMLPPWKTGGLDLSPIIVLLAIQFIERVILPLVARPLLY